VRATLIAILGAAAALAQPQVTIAVEGQPPFFRVSQSGVLGRLSNPNLAGMFRVSVDQPGAEPMNGDFSVDKGTLVFRPKYPLQPGVTYRAEFSLLAERASLTYTEPKPVVVPTTVLERVYPSAAKLPENQLKLYLHFSAPMGKGEAFRRVRLLEDGGGAVSLPFLEIDEELWDREYKRLTILFDPGRIKRDLVPNKEVGPPIRAGKSYTLEISAEWRDAKGAPLKEGFTKRFSVGEADRTPLDTKTWKLLAPSPGTREAVVLDFPEPVDAALVQRFIDVVDSTGALVAGSVALDNEESRWIFTPAESWKAGKYALQVLSGLEDLAGNRVGRAFDVDRFEKVEQPLPETVSIPFAVAN
jgi:hypothetical protein